MFFGPFYFLLFLLCTWLRSVMSFFFFPFSFFLLFLLATHVEQSYVSKGYLLTVCLDPGNFNYSINFFINYSMNSRNLRMYLASHHANHADGNRKSSTAERKKESTTNE